MRHELKSSPDTVHWGFWDPSLSPVLTIRSGDDVTVHTVSGNPDNLPDDKQRIPSELLDILRNVPKGEGGHILTGPIAIDGAEVGNVLEVQILDIALSQDWARNHMLPFKGTLPEDFPNPRKVVIDLDLRRKVAKLLPGVEISLKDPFFGNFGVAPRPNYGRLTSQYPAEHGGNLDNKALVTGTKVYFPVWNRGALFSVGDGHGAQGDGECDQSAIETALIGTFRFTVRKDLSLSLPQAETPTHYITMGFDPDLDDAVKMALREMITYLVRTRGMSREQAYSLCSAAVDIHITQLVNVYRGAHCMLPKSIFITP